MGDRMEACVILAGGAWSSLFCRHHGIDFPQASVNATVLRMNGNLSIPDGAVGTPTVCIRQRLDGGITVAYKGKGTLDMVPDTIRYAQILADVPGAAKGSQDQDRRRFHRRSGEPQRGPWTG